MSADLTIHKVSIYIGKTNFCNWFLVTHHDLLNWINEIVGVITEQFLKVKILIHVWEH